MTLVSEYGTLDDGPLVVGVAMFLPDQNRRLDYSLKAGCCSTARGVARLPKIAHDAGNVTPSAGVYAFRTR